MTRDEAAARLSLHVRHVDTLIARGELPVIRIGKKAVRILDSDLSAFVESRRTSSASGAGGPADAGQQIGLAIPDEA